MASKCLKKNLDKTIIRNVLIMQVSRGTLKYKLTKFGWVGLKWRRLKAVPVPLMLTSLLLKPWVLCLLTFLWKLLDLLSLNLVILTKCNLSLPHSTNYFIVLCNYNWKFICLSLAFCIWGGWSKRLSANPQDETCRISQKMTRNRITLHLTYNHCQFHFR